MRDNTSRQVFLPFQVSLLTQEILTRHDLEIVVIMTSFRCSLPSDLVHLICRDCGQVTGLDSKQMILYTWDDPQGPRKLFRKPYTGIEKPIEVPVDKV